MATFLDKLGYKVGVFEKGERSPYGTLNPEQVNLTKSLGSYLTNQANSGPDYYNGPLSAGMSAEENANIANYSRLNALRGTSLSDIFNTSPDALNSEFTSQVEQPTLDSFRRNVLPLLQENTPAFSTYRPTVIANAYSDLYGNLSQQRFAAQQARREQAIGASGALDSAGTSSAATLAIPREVQQAGLDRSYADYIQANQTKQNSINQMLNFLGISTVAQTPDGLSPTAQLGIEIGKIIAGAQTGGKK